MPAYDYRCTECESTFEVTRAITDVSDVMCPACGTAAKRVFSPVGVVFKGTGFHTTDYRSAGSRAASESSAEAKTPPSCGSSGTTPACSGCPAAD